MIWVTGRGLRAGVGEGLRLRVHGGAAGTERPPRDPRGADADRGLPGHRSAHPNGGWEVVL